MKQPPKHGDHHWDGSRIGQRSRRTLRVAPDSRTRALRAPQSRDCNRCGNRVEWFPRVDGRPVALHPHEIPVRAVPWQLRWQVCQGVAYPFPDKTPWCRVAHAALCPASEPTNTQLGRLRTLRLHMAVVTRRLTDLGLFTPPATESKQTPESLRLPVVLLLSVFYLAPTKLSRVRCIAQTRQRTRCTQSLAAEGQRPELTCVPIPAVPDGRHLRGDLTGSPMQVFDLTHLPYLEQIRWRQQRCTWHHQSLAPDVMLTEWQVFDAFAHHDHVRLMPDGEDGRKA